MKLNQRITPAYAGKSFAIPEKVLLLLDHPRLCGEKQRLNSGFSAFEGSPPPMRGKGTYMDETISIYRITPAYAGKRVQLSPVW